MAIVDVGYEMWDERAVKDRQKIQHHTSIIWEEALSERLKVQGTGQTAKTIKKLIVSLCLAPQTSFANKAIEF